MPLYSIEIYEELSEKKKHNFNNEQIEMFRLLTYNNSQDRLCLEDTFMDFFVIMKFILGVFKAIPQKQREQIVQAFIDLLSPAFRKKKKYKEDINKDDVDMKTYSKNITTVQWNSTIGAVTNLLPSTFSREKKEKFTASLIELVQSDEFLDELNKRIDAINLVDDDLYQEQCSLEMRKLIAEMLRK